MEGGCNGLVSESAGLTSFGDGHDNYQNFIVKMDDPAPGGVKWKWDCVKVTKCILADFKKWYKIVKALLHLPYAYLGVFCSLFTIILRLWCFFWRRHRVCDGSRHWLIFHGWGHTSIRILPFSVQHDLQKSKTFMFTVWLSFSIPFPCPSENYISYLFVSNTATSATAYAAFLV